MYVNVLQVYKVYLINLFLFLFTTFFIIMWHAKYAIISFKIPVANAQ